MNLIAKLFGKKNEPRTVVREDDLFTKHMALAAKVRATFERKSSSLNFLSGIGAVKYQRLIALWRQSAECSVNDESGMNFILMQMEAI